MQQEQSNMARGAISPQKQAELLKDQGNMCFKKDRLAAAIEAYTQVHFLIVNQTSGFVSALSFHICTFFTNVQLWSGKYAFTYV